MKTFLLICICLMAVGCASVRSNITDMIEQDRLNAVISRQAARQILATWKLNGSFLSEINKDYGQSLPCECQAGIDQLMKYADECTLIEDAFGDMSYDCSKVTDDKLGATIYIWARVWTSITRSVVGDILKNVMPAVFDQFSKYSLMIL